MMDAENTSTGVHLNAEETRVLGCLIEKQRTTPDTYPLTLNALRSACNQKSNRDPVVDYEERDIVRALDGLRDKKLTWMITSSGGRVPKYEHSLDERLQLGAPQMAILCVLMLRGPQTAGEIKTRADRLHPFVTVTETENTLSQMMTREAGALVVRLPLQPGKREPRYAHLLAGEPEVEAPPPTAPRPEPARVEVEQENARFEALESELAELREELDTLRNAFDAFRSQFE